jgi:Putative auto-transporter adhesin, head GIN domain
MAVAPTATHMRHAPHRHRLSLAAAVVLALAALATVLIVHYDVFGSSTGSATVQGSGVATSQLRRVPAFDSVELGGSNTVTIHVGGKRSVLVRADDNLVNRVTTQVRGGTLAVGNSPGSFTTRTPMGVELTMPRLAALTLSGSGVVSATGIDEPVLTVRLTGSGVLHATGHTRSLHVALTGSGDAQLEQLVARDARVVVSGSGRVVLTAKHSLFASVPGTGVIVYGGNPERVTSNVTGTGVVSRG